MRGVAAAAVGFWLGLKTRDVDVKRLQNSLQMLFGTDEFGEVLSAGRCIVVGQLRGLADLLEARPGDLSGSEDLLARVKRLVDDAGADSNSMGDPG